MSYVLLRDDELIRRFEEIDRDNLKDPDQLLCLELMRRAFVVKSSQAFEAVERFYGNMFRYWARTDGFFDDLATRWGDSVADDIVQESYANIMRTLADCLDFEQKFGGKFSNFLGYVRTSIYSTTRDMQRHDRKADSKRKAKHGSAADEGSKGQSSPQARVSLDEIAEVLGAPDSERGLDFAELCTYIESKLTKNQWILFQYIYIFDMRPREIAAAVSSLQMDSHQISSMLYRIHQTLKDDLTVRDMLNLKPSSPNSEQAV